MMNIKKCLFMCNYLFLLICFFSTRVASAEELRVTYKELSERLIQRYSFEAKGTEKQGELSKKTLRELHDLEHDLGDKSKISWSEYLTHSFRWNWPKFKFPEPQKIEKMSIVSSVMQGLGSYHRPESSLSLEPLLKDLEFFLSLDGGVKHTVFSFLDKTKTSSGKLVLASMLSNHRLDFPYLSLRANFIEGLSKNKKLLKSLEQEMRTLEDAEKKLVEFWRMDPSLIDGINSIIGKRKTTVTNWVNLGFQDLKLSGTFTLSAIKYLPFIFLDQTKQFIGSMISIKLPSSGLLAAINHLLADGLSKANSVFSRGIETVSGGSISTVSGAVQGLGVLFLLNSLYKWKIRSWDPHRKRNRLYKRVTQFTKISQTLLRSLRKIDRSLRLALPESVKILKHASLVEGLDKRGGKIKSYIKRLSKRSDFFDISGLKKAESIKLAHLIREGQGDFAEIFEAMGEIEAYLSIVRLLEKSSNSKNKFSGVKFIQSKKPALILEGFWNPMLNPNQAVANDLRLEDSTRGVLLTGSNTGGKSTLLRAIASNLITAQGLGIASSNSTTMTPFKLLISSIHISDSLGEGESLFQSEVKRAGLIHSSVQALEKNQFGFVILDELFTGTNYSDGSRQAKRFSDKLFIDERLLSIFATHYHDIAKNNLEEESSVKNMKMDVIRNQDGTYKRTFKLEKGLSTESVVDDMINKELEK